MNFLDGIIYLLIVFLVIYAALKIFGLILSFIVAVVFFAASIYVFKKFIWDKIE